MGSGELKLRRESSGHGNTYVIKAEERRARSREQKSQSGRYDCLRGREVICLSGRLAGWIRFRLQSTGNLRFLRPIPDVVSRLRTERRSCWSKHRRFRLQCPLACRQPLRKRCRARVFGRRRGVGTDGGGTFHDLLMETERTIERGGVSSSSPIVFCDQSGLWTESTDT